MKSIHQVSPELLKGKRILLRTDFNVPLSDSGAIMEPARIEGAMKTIAYLKNCGTKIILLSHIGRDPDETLEPIYRYLKSRLDLTFINHWDKIPIGKAVENMKEGEIILLQNVRAQRGEENNEPQFAQFLASLAELYVNDAFSVSHREHASVVGVPNLLKSYCGCQFKSEFDTISKVFDPVHPYVVLMGGAKFETKIPVIESILPKADTIFVGGALANDILKANGYEVGQSKVNDMDKAYAKEIFNNKKVIVVEDVKIKSFLFAKNKSLNEITSEDKIIDGGVETATVLSQKIAEAKLIVWNGNFGTFEQGNSFLSKKVIDAISKSDAYTIAGGGDTVAEIKKLKKEKCFDFISLSGGAMLEFIAKGTLPGIEAMKC